MLAMFLVAVAILDATPAQAADGPGAITTMPQLIASLKLVGNLVQSSNGTLLLGYSTTTPCGNAMPKGFVIAYDVAGNRVFGGPLPYNNEPRIVIMDDDANGTWDRMSGKTPIPDSLYEAMRSCTVAAANAATP